MTEGQNMDGSIEEVLAPLRLAVKEQVMKGNNKHIICCIIISHNHALH